MEQSQKPLPFWQHQDILSLATRTFKINKTVTSPECNILTSVFWTPDRIGGKASTRMKPTYPTGQWFFKWGAHSNKIRFLLEMLTRVTMSGSPPPPSLCLNQSLQFELCYSWVRQHMLPFTCCCEVSSWGHAFNCCPLRRNVPGETTASGQLPHTSSQSKGSVLFPLHVRHPIPECKSDPDAGKDAVQWVSWYMILRTAGPVLPFRLHCRAKRHLCSGQTPGHPESCSGSHGFRYARVEQSSLFLRVPKRICLCFSPWMQRLWHTWLP